MKTMTEKSSGPITLDQTAKSYQIIIAQAEGKIASHREFKAVYNQEMAFGFDFFRFFKVGENKVSKILAYFLNPKEQHGQGDLFLKDFTERIEQKLQESAYSKDENGELGTINEEVIEQYQNAILGISRTNVKTEQPIDRIPDKNGRRRIDIYIPLGGYAIAVENKIWAKDQPDQMKHYKEYLQKKHKQGSILIYLTPYGQKPEGISITDTDWKEGLSNGSICSMTYKHDILPMLQIWEATCKAERVRLFIREFRNHLRVKFLGGNNLTMTKALEPIIRNNAIAAKELTKAYNLLETKMKEKIDYLAKKLDPSQPLKPFLQPYDNPTHYVVKKAVKVSVSSENIQSEENHNVFVHLSEHNLELRLTFYTEDKSNSVHTVRVRKNWENADQHEWEVNRIPSNDQTDAEAILILNHNIPNSELLNLFKKKVELVKEALVKE